MTTPLVLKASRITAKVAEIEKNTQEALQLPEQERRKIRLVHTSRDSLAQDLDGMKWSGRWAMEVLG